MFHMQRNRRLAEEHARFYAAEISVALNFLHCKGLSYTVYNMAKTQRLSNDFCAVFILYFFCLRW